MTEKDHMDYIEAKAEYLQNEKNTTIKVLEAICSVRNLNTSLNKLDNHEIILENAFNKLLALVRLKNGGFFLVDEHSSNFTPTRFFPEEDKELLLAETDKLIIDGTFAMAVKSGKTTIIKSKTLNSHILLHSVSTISRTRGLFIGQLNTPKEEIPDAVFYLITILMNETAHQLESFELYNRNKETNRMLSESVKKLEGSEQQLKNFNEKLEAEVYNRTKELKATNDLLENEISERKKIEKLLVQQKKALQELNETLENRVVIETENRRKSERILHEQSKLAAMGQMMKAVSHQWRQPLNALGMIIQDMVDEHDEKGISAEYLQDSVNKCLKLVMHMSSTIDDFSALVRSDTEKDSFNLATAIQEVISLVEVQYNRLGIFLESEISGECSAYGTPPRVFVRGDSGMFKQIIMNLLANSKDAILPRLESGRSEKGLIRISLKCDEQRAVVDIEDNGGGIPEDIIDRVFEPYFTTKIHDKGTGIGLYISRLVIQEHMQGEITAGNSMNGAVLTLHVPLSS